MITVSPATLQPDDWQRQLAQAISDPAELIQALQLPATLLAPAQRASTRFPLRVTRHFLSLMEPGNPHDPLLRQVLPLQAEESEVAGFSLDPVGDRDAALGAGILQKYRGRALLIATGACAVHCRYCFRRNYPYAEDNAVRHWQSMLEILATRRDISEVILSGGDPLSLSDSRLAELLSHLEDMPHLQRLRLHTRLPVVLPARITGRLVSLLADSRLDAVMVLHSNHPNELTPALQQGVAQLRAAGVSLLNQSVLLAGVNDTAPILVSLSERLFSHGILPYYLHMLDPVQGAAHFEVPQQNALALLREMRHTLPGYLVPRLVREIAGEPSKTPLDSL